MLPVVIIEGLAVVIIACDLVVIIDCDDLVVIIMEGSSQGTSLTWISREFPVISWYWKRNTWIAPSSSSSRLTKRPTMNSTIVNSVSAKATVSLADWILITRSFA